MTVWEQYGIELFRYNWTRHWFRSNPNDTWSHWDLIWDEYRRS